MKEKSRVLAVGISSNNGRAVEERREGEKRFIHSFIQKKKREKQAKQSKVHEQNKQTFNKNRVNYSELF
jgi:hypothetical protein